MRTLAHLLAEGVVPGRPAGIPPGTSCAPSSFKFCNMAFFLYSMTLRCLKYVTFIRCQQSQLERLEEAYPAASTILLQDFLLFAAYRVGRLGVPDAIDNTVLV